MGRLVRRNATARPPAVELLESRLLPTAYVVTTAQDILGDTTPGEVTLRDAILALNGLPSGNATVAGTATNSISFAIPGSGPQTIAVGAGNFTGGLPAIAKQVFLDGWSQGGAGYHGPPLIVLDGTDANVPFGTVGLTLNPGSDGSTVRGLAIGNFGADGIELLGTTGNLIAGNYLGTDASGTAAQDNAADGLLLLNGARANTIGGTGAGAGNVISGNRVAGVYLTGTGTGGNLLLGNRIGTDATGTVALGNAYDGIDLGGTASNTVGGTASGAGNVISGNGGEGLALSGAGTSGNMVLGNRIGTDVTGTKALGNGSNGIFLIAGPSANTIGGTAAGAGNVLADNGFGGVALQGGGGFATSGNVLLGNRIGTDVTGTQALGNHNNGVFFAYDANANTIGGTAAGAGNVISANGAVGIDFYAQATGNLVLGNRIGTDISGTVALGNGGDGVITTIGSVKNTIGGTAPGAGNLISGNAGNGIGLHDFEQVGDPPAGNVVLGNLIGTDATGTAALGNTLDGVFLDSKGCTVGGTAPGAGNVISGNGGDGVHLSAENVNANAIDGRRDTQDLVVGNLIGTDRTGTVALGNHGDGVHLDTAARGNTIGGTAAGAGNVIAANGRNGVEVSDGAGLPVSLPPSGNVILGNLIGTDKTGTIALGNSGNGVFLTDDGTADTVGGTAAGAGNVISGNGGDGVELGNSTSKNVVLGNLIGAARGGTAPLGNGGDGVLILFARDNTIGGTAAGAANVISANSTEGVEVEVASGNVILGNRIGTDKSGTAPLGNGGDGVFVGGDATANTVGGTAPGAANVISANGNGGVQFNGDAGTSGNVVLGNLIGTDRTGIAPLGNTNDGVFIAGAAHNTIGGTAAGAANVIAANHNNGVDVADSSGNLVQGNRIGTDKSGTIPLGNSRLGVSLSFGATGNTIGGTAAGAGNVIAFNGGGVALIETSTVGDRVLGNSIYGNTGIGIDLGDDGPTPNGANPRSFPNDGQNTPVITRLTLTSVSGKLSSIPKTSFRLEFFASPATGTAGQGKTFLGAANVMTKADGTASFTAAVLPIPAGSVVTATATNLSSGDTSEFSVAGTQLLVLSAPVIVSGGAAQVVTLKAQLFAGGVPLAGAQVTFTVTGLPGRVTGAVDAAGYVTVSFTLPAGTAPSAYTIVARYTGGWGGDAVTADGLLTVLPPQQLRSGPGIGRP